MSVSTCLTEICLAEVNQTHQEALITETSTNEREDETELPSLDAWTRTFSSGLKALQNRRYIEAEQKFLSSVKDAKRNDHSDSKLIEARSALAELYCLEEKYDDAEKLLDWTLNASKRLEGLESRLYGVSAYHMALVNYIHGNYPKADSLCRAAIPVLRKSTGISSREVGKAYILIALVLGKENFPDEAEPFLNKGLRILQAAPGVRQLDLADGLRTAALFRQSQGRREEAAILFNKSYEITDRSVAFDQTQKLRGRITYRWEEGSPRAEEIPDNDFPLRYMTVNGIRVAATIIDLWELSGVLISITNVGDERATLGLDKVNLDKLSLDANVTQKSPMQVVDPNSIDRIRRERVMWDLTMNRPWLANIQKTRSVRGLVPANGHDLFRGPNIFGVYGEWGAVSRVMPDRLAVHASPERVQYQEEHTIDNGLIRSSTIKMAGLIPVSLEPFESRTGEIFYINTRSESLLLTVRVGNTCFEIPFHCRRKRIQ